MQASGCVVVSGITAAGRHQDCRSPSITTARRQAGMPEQDKCIHPDGFRLWPEPSVFNPNNGFADDSGVTTLMGELSRTYSLTVLRTGTSLADEALTDSLQLK